MTTFKIGRTTGGLLKIGGGISPKIVSGPLVVTGGTITTSGLYTVHTFLLSGSSFFCSESLSVEYLVIGGGGSGGGTYHGGGGGAGGFQTGTGFAVTNGTYPVTVGLGGIATTAQGNNGASSIFSSITSLGGQGGASWYNYPTTPPTQASLGTKASGGGACYGSNVGGVGTVGQGKNGGTAGTSGNYGSGGGGGSTSAGGNGTTTTGGAGGTGTASSISGISTTYCGGGGGSTYAGGTPGAGGSGGGTAGVGSGSALAAAANTGGGGGGGERTNGTGGAGGSGIVIIRYLTPVSFTPQAVLLTSGTSYSIPAGATTMKAWVVGGGGCSPGSISYGGGCAYKTWSVSGASISYVLGVGAINISTASTSSTATYSSVTITGNNGSSGLGSYSGGDGGANGGSGGYGGPGGAVGGDSATTTACGRKPATDISGLFAALTLAGVSTTETCGATAAFGSAAYANKYNSALTKTAGYGGRGAYDGGFTTPGGNGALVLYFT